MSFDIETDEDLDDLEWPVTAGECVVLVTGYLLALIGTGLTAAWVLEQAMTFIFKR